MNLLKYRWLFVGIFVTTMILSALFIFVNPHNNWGTKRGPSLNLGIDFTGGSKIYFPVSRAVSSDEVTAVLKTINISNFKFNAPQPNQYVDHTGVIRHQVLVYTTFLNNTEQEIVVKALEDKFGVTDQNQGLDVTRVDPFIGKELVNNALMAVAIASLLMLVYIWFRFELVSGVAAVIALLHDGLVMLGFFGLFGKEVDSTIIAAVLTILGYSINDTIVVFDRIRENLKYKLKDTPFVEVANESILQTFRRSLNTSFVTILAVLALFVIVPNLQLFCFALIVGITSGTYSSIFVASPIWAVYKDWQEKNNTTRKAVANTAK
jgi:preprotein translocase subunit SecF